MKILIGGIGQETNMFSTQKVYYRDFHEYTGENVVARLFPNMTETEKKEIQFVPAVYANITPSGPLDQSEFQIFIQRFFDAIPNPREIDAIYLCLHGAMYVTGIGSGEAYLLSQVRKVFGKRILISASFDFHGNMSPEALRHLNLCTAYRTAPHIDEQETRSRALRNLVYCYKKRLRPSVSMVQIPVVLPGEKVITADPPCYQMIQRVNRLMERENIIDASLLCGFAWADHNYITMSITVSRTEPQAEQAELLKIADSIWADRDRFSYSVDAKEPMDAILQAIQDVQKEPERNKPVFLSDSGDNITAGAAGDRTDLLPRSDKGKSHIRSRAGHY